jgi:hypothetical protein
MTKTKLLVNTGSVMIMEKNALTPYSVPIHPTKEVYKKLLSPGTYEIAWKIGDFKLNEVESGTFLVTPDHTGQVTILAGDMCEIVAPSYYHTFLKRIKSGSGRARSLSLLNLTTKQATTCKNMAYIVTGADGLYDIELTATKI